MGININQARPVRVGHYSTPINHRALESILAGTKTVEIRTNGAQEPLKCEKLRPGDKIDFRAFDAASPKTIRVEVVAVRHYASSRSLIEAEGIRGVCSSAPETVDEAVRRIEEISGYRQAIPRHGIYAIQIGSARLLHST